MRHRKHLGLRSLRVEPLEDRRLLSVASAYDQYLVELINEAREDPATEAARLGIDLNEGLPAGTISTDPKQPLAVNPYLTDAAQTHSDWMLSTDTFSHTGDGGSDPGDRMDAAGYAFAGSWGWGENIAWQGTTGTFDRTEYTSDVHGNLFVDENYPGRGHRVTLMNDDYREIGPGVRFGEFTTNRTYNAIMATEDFAYSGSEVFLTGVAYDESVWDDDFYTPGEGLSGVTITATRTDGATYSTTTEAAGGYALSLPPGTYRVVASGGGLGGRVVYDDVPVGSENVKRDFTPEMVAPAEIAGRHVFYNDSYFDDGPAANRTDDDAIALSPAECNDPDLGKTALLPGESGSFQNITSYDKGLNGIMVDVQGLAGAPTAADFDFRMGNDADPAQWTAAPSPSSVTVRPGEGAGGSDRITLVWPNFSPVAPDPSTQAVANQWLRVTVQATSETGLAAPGVFYFGNAIGDSGTGNTDTHALVSAIDFGMVRDNPHSPGNRATLCDPADYNRDSLVNAIDFGLVRDNPASPNTALEFITVPAAPSPPASDSTAAVLHDAALSESDISSETGSRELSSGQLAWIADVAFSRRTESVPDRTDPARAAVERLVGTL